MEIQSRRNFLRFYNQENYQKFVPESDQDKKLPIPPLEIPYPANSILIDLIHPDNLKISQTSFLAIVNSRKSRRKFTDEYLTLEELSYLLWCTQGVKKEMRFGTFRTVPSAGARCPIETFLYIGKVKDLTPGLYRYISLQHKLLFIKTIDNPKETLSRLAYNQDFVANGAVIFIWVAVPYRTEWRYTVLSHKFIAIDLGIICENLYLACEARDLGTVAIGYYEQENLDYLLELNSKEYFSVLIAPVGKIPHKFELQNFFSTQKTEVTIETLKKYLGMYEIPNGPQVNVILEKDHLIITSDIFQEFLKPHSETEFIGGEMLRAVRMILDEKGSVIKMVVLPGLISDKDIIELIKK